MHIPFLPYLLIAAQIYWRVTFYLKDQNRVHLLQRLPIQELRQHNQDLKIWYLQIESKKHKILFQGTKATLFQATKEFQRNKID